METKILQIVKDTKLNVTELSKFFNISREELIEILIKNGYYELKNNPKARFPTVKRLREAALYFINNNVAYSNVAEMFGIKKAKLKEYLEKWYPNIPVIKINHNDHIFDEIDTEEKAYWLGFLFADGYISSKPLDGHASYGFELTLSYKDIDHLRKFANFIGYNKEIKKRIHKQNEKEYASGRISISSKHLWEILNSYGCTPRKSLTLKFPDEKIFKNKSLIRHFIRGYVEGDGSLGIYDAPHGEYTYHNQCMCSILGTPEFLEGIQKYLKTEQSIKTAGSDNHPNRAFRLTYICKEALTICFKLYENSTIFMDRKYLKYLEFCRLYKELYKELSGNIGETPEMDNTEINSEIKESESSYSVDSEPIEENI